MILLELESFEGLLELEGFIPEAGFELVPEAEFELEIGITKDCPILTSGVLNLFASRIALTLTP